MQTDPASRSGYAASAFLATKLSFSTRLRQSARRSVLTSTMCCSVWATTIASVTSSCVRAPAGAFPASKDSTAIISIADDPSTTSLASRPVEQFDRIVRKVESVVPLDGAAVNDSASPSRLAPTSRESPAIAVMARLVAKGATVKAYDPAVTSSTSTGLTSSTTPTRRARRIGHRRRHRVERVHLARFRQDR